MALMKYPDDGIPTLSRRDGLSPYILWMCDSDFAANRAFDLCERAAELRRARGYMATGATRLTSLMDAQQIAETLEKGIQQRSRVLITVPYQFHNQARNGHVDFSKVKKVVLDELTMLLAQSPQAPVDKFFARLLPRHSIVALCSTYSSKAAHKWRTLTSWLGRELSSMPRFTDSNQQRLLTFIASIVKWHEVGGHPHHLPRHCLKKYLTGDQKLEFYGKQRVLAICKREILMCEVQASTGMSRYHRSEENRSDPYTFFGCRVPVAVRDRPKALSAEDVRQFDNNGVDVLPTDQHYIHGYNYNFLPILFFMHIPLQFDELLSMFQRKMISHA